MIPNAPILSTLPMLPPRLPRTAIGAVIARDACGGEQQIRHPRSAIWMQYQDQPLVRRSRRSSLLRSRAKGCHQGATGAWLSSAAYVLNERQSIGCINFGQREGLALSRLTRDS